MNKEIIKSWNKNAKEWIKVIDNKEIQSRVFTNKAVEYELDKIIGNRILDIGCGEGWLTRSITAMGKEAVGIDVIEALLVNAKSKGPEPFYQMGYNNLIAGEQLPEALFDAAVYNFSLYQKENVDRLLESTKKYLIEDGKILIQTLHPSFLLNNGLDYRSQLISNSWKGLPGNFIDGHEWYARTFEDWVNVISKSGMRVNYLKEIVNFEKKPISLILVIS